MADGITLTKDIVETYAAPADCHVQANAHNVAYQTDIASDCWAVLIARDLLYIPAGKVIYFRSSRDEKLAVLEV